MPRAVAAARLCTRETSTSTSLMLVRSRRNINTPHRQPQRLLPFASVRCYAGPPRGEVKLPDWVHGQSSAKGGRSQKGAKPESGSTLIPWDLDNVAKILEEAKKEEEAEAAGKVKKPKPKTIHGAIDRFYKDHIWGMGSRDVREILQARAAELGTTWGSIKGSGNILRMGEDEPDRDLWTGDDETKDSFDEDDILSMAHLKLEEHREAREYARITAWEMPLLANMAKEYQRPPAEQQMLRFRHTTYLGEYHPAERKVVVEFCPDDLPFQEEWQATKLKKLAGVRYNPEKNVIKMSCESFEHPAQNKRRLGNLVSNLVQEAVDPAERFEDVPLDLRHHRFKGKPKFPVSWRLSDTRAAEISQHRTKTSELDRQLIDGNKVVMRSFGHGKSPTMLPTAGPEPTLTAGDEKHAAPGETTAVPPPEMAPEMVPERVVAKRNRAPPRA